MRPPSILDVVRAVKTVASGHDEVKGWWYAPPKRLRLAGESPGDRTVRHVEIAVEGEGAPEALDALASELSSVLHGAPVRVRAYRGRVEDGHLFRLLRGDSALPANG